MGRPRKSKFYLRGLHLAGGSRPRLSYLVKENGCRGFEGFVSQGIGTQETQHRKHLTLRTRSPSGSTGR